MELIKDTVKQFYPLMIAVSCLLFVIWIFFSAGMSGGTGVFESSGMLFSPVVDTGEIKYDGASFVKNEVSGYVPIVRYTGGARTSGDIFVFKELLQVRQEDGSWVSGSLEDDFTIYLMDIRNQSGNSAMLCMTEEEIAWLEDIPEPFLYEKELDLLCCYSSGIYTVTVKLYVENGGMAVYEFKLPVEVG